MRKYILSLLLLLLVKITFSQFSDSVHHYIKYAATGMVNKTNDVRSYILNNAFSFNISRKKIDFNSSSAWIYGRQDDLLTNNDFTSALNFDLLRKLQRLYYWGLANYTTSYSLKIKYQFQTGAGIGYNIVKRPSLELVVSDGILYEAANLNDDLIGKDIYHTFRNSLRFKHRWVINDIVTLEGTHFWQPSLTLLNDYILRSSSSLYVKLRKWLSITGAVTYNKLSRTRRENWLINFGLTAEKYF